MGDPQFVQSFYGRLKDVLKSLMEIVVFKLGEWEKNLRVAIMNILTLKKGTRSTGLENRSWIVFFFFLVLLNFLCIIEFWWENWKVTIKDENISNHWYISNLILWIYQRNISGHFGKKKSVGQKLIKIRGNVRKTS